MEIAQIFKDIVGFPPYDFQLQSINELSQGASLVLMAPTGSGKSEVPIVSFLSSKDENLPSQMIYSLPTRTLIENLSKRVQKYASSRGFSTAFHHGKRTESELFNEDIILTTIDQTVGAYVCTPLSAPVSRGNILAGAVSSAFLVFDEIHTYDPVRGLQTSITLIEHSSRLGLPFTVMSATLPDLLINKIKKIAGKKTKVIKVEDESEIRSRKNRKVILHTKALKENKKISVEEILGIYNSSKDKKLIVVCNTVEKAQQIYQELIKRGDSDSCIILIHSRFLHEDRKEKEELLQKLFSKESREPVILVSTQVIEVGMDISSDTMISEVAPIDSLIQRAGRCARWGGEGDFYVFDIEDYGPYRQKEYQQIVDKTREELKKLDGEILSWNLERELTNKILSGYYEEILDDSHRAEILGTLARAVFEGDRSKAEECVREAYTCSVSIHNNPKILCNEKNDILKLQKVDINVWVFQSKAKKLLESGISIWSIEESNILDDYTFKFTPVAISDVSQILPFKHYIVSPEGAYYDKDIGLILEKRGSNIFTLSEEEIIENKQKEWIKKYELWIDHANRTLQESSKLLSHYNFAIKKFSEAFGVDKKDLIEKIRIATALHDIGKLNKYWQRKVGGNEKTPLAHSDKVDITRIGIPHATVSAEALKPLFVEWGLLGECLLRAIAHHHSPRSREYKAYEFISGWDRVIEQLQLNIDPRKIIPKKNINGETEFGNMIYLGYETNIIPYRFYSFVSKILRLSDWLAISGENGVLHS